MSTQVIDINTSREEIRQRLLNEYAQILLVDSEELDQSDSAFNTYVINALSYIMADNLYYASIVYRESTLITGNLPDTILNWAAYLDYTPRRASAATVNLLIEMPIESSFTATIPAGHEFTAINGISFRAKYKTEIEVSPSGSKKVETITSSGVYALPINVSSIDNKPYMSFIIEAEQYTTTEYEFVVPTLQAFEYYYKVIELSSDDNILDIIVYVDGELWDQKKLVLLQPNEKGYEAIIHKNQVELLFGNGFFGKQPSGVINVTIKLTKGQNGNVIAGTITSGKPLVSDFNIKYSVINPESAKNGSDFESLEDIRRNAIASLKMMKRIVSQEDFENITSILGLDETIISTPILKRSDLACNDVYTYLVLNYNNEIVPTNSIPITISGMVTSYKPLEVFPYDGKQWVCPFALTIDLLSNIITYYYIKPKEIYTITKIFDNSATHLVSKAESRYDGPSDNVYFYVYIIRSDDTSITYSQELILQSPLTSTTLTPISVDNLQYNIVKYTYVINRLATIGVEILQINTYEDTGSGPVLRSQYKTTAELNFDLKEITYSHIVENPAGSGNYEGLDIPVFEKDYWDSLSQDDQDNLQILAIGDIIQQVNSYSKRMMNVHVSGKFAKTIGKTENTKYDTPDYFVVSIHNSSSTLPAPSFNPGSYFALSDISNVTDPFYEYSGSLVISDGSQYHGLRVGRGTIIRNLSDNNIYSTDGRRWVMPYYDLPLQFVVELHVQYLNIQIIEQCQDIILDYINNLGIEGNLYLSQIIDRIHNLDTVKYCRIIKPETDIIYRDVVKNLTREEMYYYTPEYLYTTRDLIKIIPIAESN